ncbi:MAG: GtrA family protein [Thermoleophilia bacterium]
MATGQVPRTSGRRALRVRRVLRVPRINQASASDWAQLVRFCVVGASGYVVNLIVYVALLNGIGLHYIESAIGAFCVAWLNNFALNRHWTFRGGGRSAASQGLRYLAVSLVALGINLALLHGLVVAGIPELPAQAVAILLVTPVAFLLNRRWAFR